jgi:glycosyl-4,4'-diaponeurosporenoate acyltransferase
MLPWPWALLVDVLVVAAWSVAVGWWMARRPLDHLTGHGWLLRLRPWEGGGQWYERRLGVRRWKDRLPEAGTWFGGLSKRRLPSGADGGLGRFRAECVRAELTHWLAVALLPVLFVWSPWWLAASLLAGGVAANLPCIVVPRFNRARLDALRPGRTGQRRSPHLTGP